VVALVVGVLAATAGPAPAAPTPTSSSTEKVIVVLRNQLGSTPANKTHIASRRQAAQASQQSVLSRLAGPAPASL
jgi:hypothetical protein